MNVGSFSYYERVAAMIDLIQFFRDGHCTTPGVIAEKYGVSYRTANRWLELIDHRWVPLERRGPNYRKAVLR